MKLNLTKKAFTLAEVLIVIGIIGVVAALTIPTLMKQSNTKIRENQINVFEAKLIQGLNMTKVAGNLHDKYKTTEDFLRNGLSQYYKMNVICGANNLKDCIPYNEIVSQRPNGKKDIYSIEDLNTPEKLHINDSGFKDVAAFISADGIPVIISYKSDCIVDSGEADTEISSCVAGIYDLNGSRKPNLMWNDVLSFNGARVDKCVVQFNGLCLGAVFKPEPLSIQQCEDAKIIPECVLNNDYWGGTVKECGGVNNLPTMQQLRELSNSFYKKENNVTVLTPETEEIRKNLNIIGNTIFSNQLTANGQGINARVQILVFRTNGTDWHNNGEWRDDRNFRGMCIYND